MFVADDSSLLKSGKLGSPQSPALAQSKSISFSGVGPADYFLKSAVQQSVAAKGLFVEYLLVRV